MSTQDTPQSKSKRRLLRQSDAVLSTRDTPPRDQDLWCLAGTNTFVIPRLFAKAQVPDSAQVIAEGTNSTIAETIDQTQDHIDHYKDGVINYGYDSGWRVHGDNFVYLEVTHAKKNQVTYGVLNSAIKALRDYMSQPGKWFGQCGFDIWDGPNQVGEGYIRSYGF
ncbi:uncharacterized protein KY384_008983 [Bacidia gigantensis]|uniref:uncharacterized protein n=1 Tax=Bacidia gigantensis TaxID=2732470 RepID=UPI001D049B13|nr:uncharacterized protein KY384_008983 [Bacidia gigantensis]KAG8525339.1 hypothetical protein KY384_008983 [Bacidia gigantensis]